MNDIEAYLYQIGTWVKAKVIAEKFNMNERSLRGEDSPIRLCAISGDKGLRHVATATQEEIEHFVKRLTAHALAELSRASVIKKRKEEFNEKQSKLTFSKFNESEFDFEQISNADLYKE